MQQSWSATDYANNGRFVADLAAPLLDLLSPKSGERILDLGCGDGALTERIAAAGAQVVGVDASEEMLHAARARGLDARHADARQLHFAEEFDAVFSNAALHWIKPQEHVLQGVRRALRPRGRFVAELGGHGNIAAICTALLAVFARRGIDLAPHLLFFPTAAEYQALLESHGFKVESIALIPRPTPLPTGMRGWLQTFKTGFFTLLPETDRAAAIAETEDLLRHVLCDTSGQWTGDYVRLRVIARLES